jgi:acyl carrier protein
MDKQQIFDAVSEIFRTVFDDEELVISHETTSEDIEDWDSLEQINLLVAMEKRFSIKFKLEDVKNLSNVGDMLDLIERLCQ